ncbi:MAG TPA: VWA domain-containing protein [Syntrophobacteraceae bacterium]|nr:VWA domain-containing protein [Syntrophobacteraceae bacterium]
MKRIRSAIFIGFVVCQSLWALPLEAQQPPVETGKKAQIEVCFVLDTTGSMSGLIEGAKMKIWSIANDIIRAKPTPDLRLGLIGYRDRGDEYITKVYDLTDDIDAIYGHLREFKAGGGGDEPESVNQALFEAVNKMSWNPSRAVLKIIFLVGDAPPHMDYKNDVKYQETCQNAVKKDLIINTVQCGISTRTTPVWQEIAKLAEGSYVQIGQTGDMVAVATPYDKDLAEVHRDLEATVVPYGSAETRTKVREKVAVGAAAPAPAAADRAAYMARGGKGKVVTGEGELLDALESGRVNLKDLKEEQLPEELKKLTSEQREALIKEKQAKRKELQTKAADLVKQRDAYLDAERRKQADAGKKDAFDAKVGDMIREQAKRKGMEYGER